VLHISTQIVGNYASSQACNRYSNKDKQAQYKPAEHKLLHHATASSVGTNMPPRNEWPETQARSHAPARYMSAFPLDKAYLSTYTQFPQSPSWAQPQSSPESRRWRRLITEPVQQLDRRGAKSVVRLHRERVERVPVRLQLPVVWPYEATCCAFLCAAADLGVPAAAVRVPEVSMCCSSC
jgi:hypothetical protein